MCKGFQNTAIALIISFLCLNARGQKIFSPDQSRATREFAGLSMGAQPDGIFMAAGISPSYYSSGLGFICRQEWKLEKSTGIAFRLRLGGLDYVNRLEGKYRW